MRQNLFMRESPLAGSNTSWTANGKPCMRVRGNSPRAVALVATDLAARLMPKTLCKSRAKPKMWDELGIWRTNWADSHQWVERFAPVGGAICPRGWSDSHHCLRGGLERFASPHDALRADLRDSLGLIAPAQKHHWAEHLAMPCPACDHECREGLRSASAATAEHDRAAAGQTGEGHGVGGGLRQGSDWCN
jgi:hypothetical protein